MCNSAGQEPNESLRNSEQGEISSSQKSGSFTELLWSFGWEGLRINEWHIPGSK